MNHTGELPQACAMCDKWFLPKKYQVYTKTKVTDYYNNASRISILKCCIKGKKKKSHPGERPETGAKCDKDLSPLKPPNYAK